MSLRRILPLVLALGPIGVAASSASSSIGVRNAPGIQIIPADEVLRDHVEVSPDGAHWFVHPGGARAKLVLTTSHPEILNPGDGSFHPADPHEVARAVESLPAALIGRLQIQIYLLPFPRSGLLSSSADDQGIYLTPGVRQYTSAQIHFLVGHELGHSYHRAYLPDTEPEGWDRYFELRGITDRDRFAPDAEHAFRPHELFAEDFRVLFAGALGSGDGNVENREVARPSAVPGLSRFLAGLSGNATESIEWLAYPNPLRPGDRLYLRGGELETADARVFDASGRQVASFPLRREPYGEWSAMPEELRELKTGAYWLRLRGTRTMFTVPLRWIR